MSAKTRRIAYMATAGGVALALMAGVTIAANVQSNNLDLLLGRGKQHIQKNGDLTAEYIDFTYETQEEALKNAQDMTQLTAEEGMTLLKNDNALPLAADEGVTVLGYYSWHNNMSGGEDPATTAGAVSLGKGIETLFGDKFNTATRDLYAANGVSADFENPAASLASAESTFASFPTAIITIKRNSGEGNDQSLNTGAKEQNRSGLVISTAELKLIDYASKHFNKVIIVVNSANAMELGWLGGYLNGTRDDNMSADGIYTDPYKTSEKYDFSKVKGAIWAGCCGSQGGKALARILKGQVNPSGHLVDTYVRDLRKDPTYQNFGSYVYDNSDELDSYQDETFFVEYEEGIYVGYRYYETAAVEASKGNYAGFDYDKQVVYPFGYGLSYTTFSQEFAETPSFDKATNEYTFKVKVTNTGSVAGKGVSQIYVNAPYTGQLEKAHVVLGGFGKTQILEPNASEVLEIKINRDYFTSFDYKGEKAYVLEAGDYNFYLSDNAHSWASIDKLESGKDKVLWTDKLDSKLVFTDKKDGKRPTDLVEAVNKEDEELNYMFADYTEKDQGEGYAINFTRSNFTASFPVKPFDDDMELTNDLAKKYVARYDVWADENNPIKEMPEVNTDVTNYTLSSMRGVDWDDPKWDDYMNQFTKEKMVEMVTNGGWNEKADEENGVPESYDADSPYGYYAAALKIKNINKWYCGDPMVAATFNVELAKKVGDAFGEEAHANYLAGGSLITGIYGYGLNMHRSAFGGRNYEYYSEDGVLAGKMAAAEASGASEKGLIVFMKHYALNDQETNRQKNGYCAWVNEQAFREVYLKGWELYMKEAKMEVKYYAQKGEALDTELSTKTMSAATGIMTCYNRIGATWGGASVSLHGILRDEFGFTGTAITDAGGQKNTYMTSDFMLRRGGHLTLTNNGTDGLYDIDSPTAVYYLKDATKHILFNKANSNCVQGIAPGDSIWYDMSPWKVGLIVAWAAIGALAVADGIYIGMISTGKVGVKEIAESLEEF